MHQHHRWAQATTALQVAIAMAAIALLTKSKAPEYLMFGVSAIGIALARGPVPPLSTGAHQPKLSAMLQALACGRNRERIAVADLLDALGDRALMRCCSYSPSPTCCRCRRAPRGAGRAAAVPGRADGLQHARLAARGDRAPLRWRGRTTPRWCAASRPWLARAERLMKPRLTPLASGAMESVVGTVCLLLALVLVLPSRWATCCRRWPSACWRWASSNRDGLWVLAGLAAGAAALVSGVVWAIVKAALYVIRTCGRADCVARPGFAPRWSCAARRAAAQALAPLG